ncbi:drug/metabolite transporter (DMT)-like permease [Paraburkholderia bannensis]|uniref:Drug/metabolite transporter (DMT)-like permease n=1 Tax=Paraburkholderia bannensis TaxID=765414 RepID=A0A7W9U410_9BURK|nr:MULTISPECIES: EamA family transporter [Paraburkholderia]MBB3261527.1 drug/metabolite transporter (DMT)-like permease [Paraburkholderia sp. WP4_3_2]MBB6106583.1 drug/metabolite transporter (DMT)-like permease [Paraburkholderia bannensis]
MFSRFARLMHLADWLLLAVAIVWGTSYGVVKHALAFYPVLGLLALRFALAFVLLSPALRTLRGVSRKALGGAMLMGGLLLAIFLCEAFGLAFTRASNAAFLVSLCVVFTPMFEWAMLRRKPLRAEWLAVAASLAGAWLLTGGLHALNGGDSLIVLAAMLRGFAVCVTKRVMRDAKLDPLAVTAVQAGCVASGSIVLAVVFAPSQWQPLPALATHLSFWGSVIWLVLGATLFAFFVQNYAVRRSSPTRVALLMGSEPAFGALFACLWLGERLSVVAWTGGALIVAASLLATVQWKRADAAALTEAANA